MACGMASCRRDLVEINRQFRARDKGRDLVSRAKIVLADLRATHAFAARLARLLRPGDVVGLSGALGSGKSEIARAAIRARAGAEIEVPSPSFTLVQDYPMPGLTIRHVDLYRIGAPAEVIELGLMDTGDDETLLVEWPERADGLLPEDRLDIRIAQGEAADARELELIAGPSWSTRLDALAHG
jgi:tRNA threonylcarbamoyl adenosine modification protein YjeE